MTSLPMSMSPTSQHLQCHHRRCRRQCSSWMVLLFGLFLLGSMTALTTTAAAPPPPFSSLAVAANDVDADAPSSTATATTTTTTFTNTRYRITTSRQLNQFIDDDDNEFDDDVAATEFDDDDSITDDDESEMGGTVCESVIAIASTRAFLEDDEDLDFDEDENEIHEDSNINPIKGMSGSSNVGRARITKSRKHSKSNKNKSEHTGEEFVCELLSGDTVPISATPDQVVQLQAALAEGTLVSAVSTIAVQEVTVVTTTSTEGGADATAAGPAAGGEEGEMVEISMEDEYMVEEIVQEAIAASPADVNSTGRFTIESVSLPPGIIQVQTEGTARKRRQLAQRQRELSSYVGTKPVLVVRVTDVNGLAPVGDAHTMSDKFFGTYGDPETMVTQFKSCSYGAFKVVTKQYPQMSAPGVLDVSIPVSLQNTRDVIRKAIHSAVEAKLGFSATPGPFAHVLYVIEKCYVDCGWAAYAYVNSWLSVYHSKYFMYPAVALHEMGHNLNLGHSGGMDGKTYTDHSCLMGNPLFSDDTADMCYNPAKTHQLIMSNGQNGHSGNWYDASRVSTWNAGGSGSVWSGKLVGVAEYDNISVDGRLVLRIVTGGSTDLYVGFNRKTGMNEDNKQGSDMVTVVQAGAGGITYSTSSLKATLTQGQSYYLPNWRGDGSSLEIFVDVIRTDVVPGYAIVRAAIAGSGGPANPPTNPPTRVPPTRKPSRPPTPPVRLQSIVLTSSFAHYFVKPFALVVLIDHESHSSPLYLCTSMCPIFHINVLPIP